jgi:hypothetical protein
MTDSVVSVGQTPAQIPMPLGAPAVLVLNSSEGIGDKPNTANIIVNNSASCSLDPQVGERLQPGQLTTFALRDSNDHPLPLFAVADAAGATLTITLIFG